MRSGEIFTAKEEKMKKIWLVSNSYLESKKHELLHSDLIKNAKEFDIELIIIESEDYAKIYANPPTNEGKPDLVLFWDKDVKFAKFLELQGIKLINSAKAIDICDDKSKTYLSLVNKGIKMPKTIISPLIYFKVDWQGKKFIKDAINYLNFPMVVKECYGSFGNQVYLVNNEKDLIDLLNSLGTIPFILQEFIESSKGRDIRVFTLGGKVICSIHRESKDGDFRSNLTLGASMQHIDCPESFKEMAEIVSRELGLDYAGLDLMFGKDGEPILCEVNSNAHYINAQNISKIDIGKQYLDYANSKIY